MIITVDQLGEVDWGAVKYKSTQKYSASRKGNYTPSPTNYYYCRFFQGETVCLLKTACILLK